MTRHKTNLRIIYCVLGWLLACMAGPIHAEMKVTLPKSDSSEMQYGYYWELLQTALELTRAEYGSYTLNYSAQKMNRVRAELELSEKNGRIDVDARAWTPERGEKLHQIKIALDRGLVGYRLLLIRRKDQGKFDAVKTLNDLKRFRFGLLNSWSDVRILEQNGLSVEAGNDFEGLFNMLDLGRFDAFSRDINEIGRELDQRQKELPNISIERSLLLRYPSARYFFVGKTPYGLKLGARLEAGLRQMQKDGSMDALFIKHLGGQIAKFKLSERRIIELTNPTLPADAEKLPEKLLPTKNTRPHKS